MAAMLALGVWQLQRLAWKEGLIADLAARQAAAPLTDIPAAGDRAALEFHRVQLSGQWLAGPEFFLISRSYQGASGLHVVTPLQLSDGRVLLVNRGWIPERQRDPATRPESLAQGAVSLSGTLRQDGWGGSALADARNDVAHNAWLFVDTQAMAAAAGLEDVVPGLYLVADPSGPASQLPVAQATVIDLPNDHLQYAITWFSLAGTFLVIFVLFHRKKALS